MQDDERAEREDEVGAQDNDRLGRYSLLMPDPTAVVFVAVNSVEIGGSGSSCDVCFLGDSRQGYFR